MSTTTTVTVRGMTCGHCVNAVHAELEKLVGVEAVDIDLASGRVDIRSASPVAETAIAMAVDEAGYEVVGDGAEAAAVDPANTGADS